MTRTDGEHSAAIRPIELVAKAYVRTVRLLRYQRTTVGAGGRRMRLLALTVPVMALLIAACGQSADEASLASSDSAEEVAEEAFDEDFEEAFSSADGPATTVVPA